MLTRVLVFFLLLNKCYIRNGGRFLMLAQVNWPTVWLALGPAVITGIFTAIASWLLWKSRRDHLSIATGEANVRSSAGATFSLAHSSTKRSLLRSYPTLIGARSIDRSSLTGLAQCIPSPSQ